MCGIIGTTDPKISNADFKSALDSIAHRGPDQGDTVINSAGVFGHHRLSIIDLSEGGRQPMQIDGGAYTIVYNGEIYNYKELRQSLQDRGCTFTTETDTEVIAVGYKEEGVHFFEKLRGMWAFAIIDRARRHILLSRDRFGIKPLYYSVRDGNLTFASELKALRALNIPLMPNTSSYATFFTLGYFVAPDTCYQDVFSLEPSEIVTYSLDTQEAVSIRLSPIHGEVNRAAQINESEAIDGLHGTLRDSVNAHYVADVPVGILFSGGNDSSLVAALSREVGRNPKAYHLAIDGSIDTEYAMKIATHLGVETEFLPMSSRELVDQYEEVWDILDTPFADLSIIPTSLIYKKIGNRSKVVLSGEGGDEWFGGYDRHGRLARHSTVRQHNNAIEALQAIYGSSTLALKYINPAIRRVRDAYIKHVTNDVIGAYLAEVKLIDYSMHDSDVRHRLRALYTKHGAGAAPNTFFDRALYLPNDLLFKNDLASMASSIEARVPFVDSVVHGYVTQTLPQELALSSTYKNKYLLKKVLERYLPSELIYRKKSGFSFSFARYHVPQFSDDVRKAILFHRDQADHFGLDAVLGILTPANTDLLIKKYPRFAFALVSSYKVFFR